jgi:general nucleoside transport system permease protein
MSELLQAAFIINLLASMIRIASPILYGALGELVTERSGIMNLGVEGMMLSGALAAFLITYSTGSLPLGTLAGIVAGMLCALLVVWMTATLKVDQVITGLAINLLCAGLTAYVFRLIFKAVSNPKTIQVYPPVKIPLLSSIPFFGEVLFSHQMLVYIAFLFAPIIWIFLYRIKYGLTLRGIGDNPRALDMKGVRLTTYQYLAVLFGGAMAGLGGAVLVQVSSGIFVPGNLLYGGEAAGRGWIAIAIVIFGNWKPGWITIGALFFGLIEALQLSLQAVGVAVPHQFLLALPYALTIVSLMIYHGRSEGPLALGRAYSRE